VITPRQTRLVRVADLHAFRHAIVRLAAPDTVVVVPTTAAARQLAHVAATFATRDGLYEQLRARLPHPPRMATALERDVIAQASARAAAARVELSFQLRPGLVGEMLRFYDHLRRQLQKVDRFQELIEEALGGADAADEGVDRGAARMRRQTAFLADAFREYQRRLADANARDEHTLRDQLIAEASPSPVRHVVVTLADWIADPDGLFLADFDLLTRISGLETIDLVATESTLASGFHERIREWFPGIEDTVETGPARKPMLVVPGPEATWFTRRDREEELVAVARRFHADRQSGDAAPAQRTAVVFKHPLPYVYLAVEVFGSAGIPFRVFDETPLAAEPTAAAFDLILDAVSSDFTRASLVALLRSPHLSFAGATGDSIAALDRLLSAQRYLGSIERLASIAEQHLSPALTAAIAAAHALVPLSGARPASGQIACLLDFWSSRARSLADDDPFAERERGARAAIVDSLTHLAAALRGQDDPPWAIDDLTVAVRRVIEEGTFAPPSSADGVALLDDRAARYGDFDDVAVVGVVDSEWPEKPNRNIFYPSRILKSLGWPSEADRRRAADARFLDLLASASRRTTVSTVTLDDDALVMRSMQLD